MTTEINGTRTEEKGKSEGKPVLKRPGFWFLLAFLVALAVTIYGLWLPSSLVFP